MAQQIQVPGIGLVEFPDGMSDADMASAIKANMPKVEDVGGGSSLTGTAKALGVGLSEGAIGLAGLPGDFAHLWAKAAGVSDAPQAAYGSGAIKKAVEGYTGEFYKPQGGVEKVANTIGQFAPAMIGGPGSIGAKLATRVVAPALASEAAGALTDDNPYAKVGGALAGAAGATAALRGLQGAAAARAVRPTLPPGEDLTRLGSNQFNEARKMDVVVRPDFVQRTAADIRSALRGYDPEQSRPVFGAVERLDGLAAPAPGFLPRAIAMNEVEFIRKQLSNLRKSNDGPTREAARTASEILTRNQAGLTAADAISGDVQRYSQLIRDAVGNYGAGKRSAVVTGKMDLAELNAATAGAGMNPDNSLRQGLKQLVRPINNTNVPVARRLGFNDAEIDLARRGATGTPFGNAARYVGKLAPTGAVSGAIGIGAGGALGGPVGAVALPVVGYIAKKIGDMSTRRAVEALDSLVRSRSPHAVQVAQQLPQITAQLPARTQGLLQVLATTPALRPSSGQLAPAGGY